MQFSPERIQELIQIHKERFDEDLTVDEASEMGGTPRRASYLARTTIAERDYCTTKIVCAAFFS